MKRALSKFCPAGWHLSSDLEWQKLEMFLGDGPGYCL
ncbi:MAG TPA: hypothetical protein ENN61_05360 [Bacteroidaceae bacterium]|nr:hypothetical protein [Bacteroidaceae bacterium]